MTTPTATSKHPAILFNEYRLPKRMLEKANCHNKNVCNRSFKKAILRYYIFLIIVNATHNIQNVINVTSKIQRTME